MPGNALSPTPMPQVFLYPDNIPVFNTTDYQLGGVGLSDASQGFQVQAWFIDIAGPVTNNSVYVSSPNTLPTLLFSQPAITEVSLSFDQNMRPAVAYVSQGNPYFWWFDTTIPGYTIISLPAGSTNPRCTLDDKRSREINIGFSDIILAYIKSNGLYMRQERDRFTVEYFLGSLSAIPGPQLNKIGMNALNRLQFQIFGNLYQ